MLNTILRLIRSVENSNVALGLNIYGFLGGNAVLDGSAQLQPQPQPLANRSVEQH